MDPPADELNPFAPGRGEASPTPTPGPPPLGLRALGAATLARATRELPTSLVLGAAVVAVLTAVFRGLVQAGAHPVDGQRAAMLVGAYLGPLVPSVYLRLLHERDGGERVRWGQALLDPIELAGPLAAYGFGLGAGLLLGIVPGLVLLSRWTLAWPVWILERQGLPRAAALSVGHRATLLTGWGLAWVPGLALSILTAHFTPTSVEGVLAQILRLPCDLLPAGFAYEAWRRLR